MTPSANNPDWNTPELIDVEAELAYWRAQLEAGRLEGVSFGRYVPWVKFGCDVALSQPMATTEQRRSLFQHHYALQIMPRLSEAQAWSFVLRCWTHLSQPQPEDADLP